MSQTHVGRVHAWVAVKSSVQMQPLSVEVQECQTIGTWEYLAMQVSLSICVAYTFS